MKLVTYSCGAERRIGFMVGEQVCDLYGAAETAGVAVPQVPDLLSLAKVDHLPALQTLGSVLGNHVGENWSYPVENVKLHAPYRPRQNITIAGGNTRDDFVAQRTKNGRPMLRYHTKAPSATIDPGQPLSWPRQLTSQVHAEPHLAVVIGARTSFAQ